MTNESEICCSVGASEDMSSGSASQKQIAQTRRERRARILNRGASAGTPALNGLDAEPIRFQVGGVSKHAT